MSYPFNMNKKNFFLNTRVSEHAKSLEVKKLSVRKTFFDGFKPVIVIGNVLGLFPWNFSNSAEKSFNDTYYRGFNISTIYSLILLIHSIVHFLNQAWILTEGFSKLNLINKMEALRSPFYAGTVAFIYCYFFKNMGNLLYVFKRWKCVNASLSALFRSDEKLRRFCVLTSIVVLGSSITENILFDVHDFHENRFTGKYYPNSTILQMYYLRSRSVLTSFLGYSPVLGILVTVLSKISTYVWNTSDIFSICICRGLTDRIQTFNEYVDKKLTATSSTPKNDAGSIVVEQIRSEFQVLVELAEIVTKFVSPLLVACYCYNIYLITLNIFRWLDPRDMGAAKAYVFVSFFQFSLRVALVTYYASSIPHSMLAIQKTLDKIPDWLYSPTVERLEHQVTRNSVGIALFGTFRVTRHFFIAIISFLFSTEIVLLQTTSSGKEPCLKSKIN